MVMLLIILRMNIVVENSVRLWLNIKLVIVSIIRRKLKCNCVFNGMIFISQVLRKIEIKMLVLRKVKVLFILEIGRLK